MTDEAAAAVATPQSGEEVRKRSNSAAKTNSDLPSAALIRRQLISNPIKSPLRRPIQLRFVGLKTLSNDDCKAIYGEAVITDGMVCAVGPNSEGTCNGDSGGPLVIDDGSGNSVHVGVVSWASASGCETNHPSGYTRTAAYRDWIDSVIA
jgi:secreted trypsin-like serine protease